MDTEGTALIGTWRSDPEDSVSVREYGENRGRTGRLPQRSLFYGAFRAILRHNSAIYGANRATFGTKAPISGP